MKKLMLVVFTFMLLLYIASCSKSTPLNPASAGNSWTLKDTIYKTTTCGYVTSNGSSQVSYLSAESDTPYNYATAQVNFATGYTIVSGTYALLNDVVYNLANNQVNLAVTRGGLSGENYYSTGGGTVNVTVTNGKITVSGTNIPVYNAANANDTARLNINLTQTR